jgi:hypothetical protein
MFWHGLNTEDYFMKKMFIIIQTTTKNIKKKDNPILRFTAPQNVTLQMFLTKRKKDTDVKLTGSYYKIFELVRKSLFSFHHQKTKTNYHPFLKRGGSMSMYD